MTTVTTSTAPVSGVLDGRTMGVEVHRLLGDLFRKGVRRPSPVELRRFVANHPLVNRPEISYRQTARQRLLIPTAIYLRLFAPSDEWEFVGAEVKLGRRRADLVWQSAQGILIDEVKAGAAAARFERDALAEQVKSLVQHGTDAYGDAFLGVRAIVLASPRTSYLARPDGSSRPIVWEVRS